MLLGLLLVGAQARAQAPAEPLPLEEAVRLALARNPEVLRSAEQLEELKGKIGEVRAQAFPEVTIQGFGLRLRDPSILNSASFDRVPQEFRDALVPRAANLFDIGLSVRQPIYTAGKVRNAIRLAEEGLREKEAALEAARRLVTFKVVQAFHDLLLAEESVAVVRDTYEQRRRHLELARSRHALGVATEIDVLRSEVNLANLEPERIRADNRVRLAQAAINNLIVVDIDHPTRAAGRLEYRPWPAPALTQLQAGAVEARPEIAVARKQVDETRLLLALAEAENRLSVDLEGRWGMSAREPNNLFDTDFNRWTVTLNFKLPVHDGGRKAGLVMQAASRLRSAELNLAQLTNNVRLEIKASHNDLQSSERAIAAARLSLVQAERVLGMMQSNYRYGAATTLDVVDSETSLTVARNALVSATYDYEMAKARLRLAAGQPILESEAAPK